MKNIESNKYYEEYKYSLLSDVEKLLEEKQNDKDLLELYEFKKEVQQLIDDDYANCMKVKLSQFEVDYDLITENIYTYKGLNACRSYRIL